METKKMSLTIIFGFMGLFLMLAFPAILRAEPTLVMFRGGIGVIPRANAAGTPNVVRGVQPAGQIWVIRDLRATVEVDGRITVDGKGLLLGGRQQYRR